MVGKTTPIREEDRARFTAIKLYCGCLLCLLRGHLDVHATIQHVTDCGRRAGKGSDQHQNTYGACQWHHFGHLPNHGKRCEYRKELGPALAHGRQPFEEAFGGEVKILIPVQNFLIAQFDLEPWSEHNISRKAARRTQRKWISLNANQS